MKIAIKYILIFFTVSLLFNSCDPDDPVEPEPEDPRDEIIGKWKCSETGDIFGQQNYDVNISKHEQDSSKVYIDNFYFLGDGKYVYAIMTDLSLSIPTQTIENDGHIVSGNGTISSNYKTITLTYTANDGSGEIDNISATYTKQTN
jgi:hypothetical protein